MRHFSEVYRHLRRKNWRQYALLAGCTFFSVLLITAYACMMRSPTVLTILPEGGDSRKQVMMVFVLAVLGCAVFTTYASGLFFRQKSREIGTFLALGATRHQLKTELSKELALLSLGSCAAGALLGVPLSWGIWQIFRTMIVDTEEMVLRFDAQAYLFALAFSVFVILMLFLMGWRSIRRTNIIDIVQESHKSEPIRAVPRWYGPVGVLLIALGGFLGYFMPSFFVKVLHWYAPSVVDALFYLPALIGLYILLLHTVVNGWGGKKKQYRDLISTSMMKFQGRQTVRNMLVMTVLLAGAYFASFYAPMMLSSSGTSVASRPYDYLYHYRCDQDMIGQNDVAQLAQKHNVDITTWVTATGSILGTDGMEHIETESSMLLGCYVLDDRDYEAISAGLTGQWQEDYVLFNVTDVEASFPFAKALFYDIVDHSGPEVEVFDAWDPVARQIAIEETGSYFCDPESLEESGTSSIDYDKPDSTEFRTSWKYMPQFKILDETELVKTMAVFLMLFIFIAIVCFAAVIVISFTRCMTIGMTNARVYDDLRHLGAPRSYLYRSVKGQVSRVFRVPILVGTILIYAFYTLIMYSNGEPMGITPSEASGMITCLGVIAVVSLLLYLVYRLTLKKVCSVTIDSKTAFPH